MKGYWFYLEYNHPSKREGDDAGNVVALCLDKNDRPLYAPDFSMQAFAGVFSSPNSTVQLTSVGRDWLIENCKRISEKKAREIHPALFERLDETDEADL